MRYVYTFIMMSVMASAAWVAPVARAIPIVQYSTDGTTFHNITLLQTSMTGAQYYHLGKHSGDPGFGIAKGTESVAFVWDTTHSDLSLVFISGGATAGERTRGKVAMAGLANGANLTLTDDNGEFSTSHKRHKLMGTFGYRDSTDGFVLSGMNATFTTKMVVTAGQGITGLRLVDGDPSAGGEFLSVAVNHPLYFKLQVGSAAGGTGGTTGGTGGTTGVGTAVPEPTSLGVLGLASLAMLKRPRRRMA